MDWYTYIINAAIRSKYNDSHWFRLDFHAKTTYNEHTKEGLQWRLKAF